MLALRRIALLILLALACASVSAQQPNAYAVRDLVSDGSVPAENTDPNLIDGWGVAFNPDGFVWVNSALAARRCCTTATVCRIASSYRCRRPRAADKDPHRHRLQQLGRLRGDQRCGDRAQSFHLREPHGFDLGLGAERRSDQRDRRGRQIRAGRELHGPGTGRQRRGPPALRRRREARCIDVFDATFTPVTLPGRFRDPELPSGFVPFAIHNLQGNLYVSFGRRNADRNFVAPGRGQGIVSVFDANGRFLRRSTAVHFSTPRGVWRSHRRTSGASATAS